MARTTSLVLSNPFVSNSLLKSQPFNKISRDHTIRRSCSSNMDDIEESTSHADGLGIGGSGMDGEEIMGCSEKQVPCATSNRSLFMGRDDIEQSSFLHSRFDFLEPMMLGIRPEFPDWMDQEMASWAAIEQKAKSLDIPLSLRMIKKKMQCEEGPMDFKESSYCSMKAAFASMVYIVVELQSYALHMREALCHEHLEIISSKVQKDMHSSFVWLFQQVFSKTPALMLHVMVILANFSSYSISCDNAVAEMLPSRMHIVATEEEQIQHYLKINLSLSENGIAGNTEHYTESEDLEGSIHQSNVHPSLESLDEMNLWNSMGDIAMQMRDGIEDEVLDQNTKQNLVSPVSVELEHDDYEDYLRTDLLYQMTLLQEPNNPLLLCNYAQFLHLVARDYDRAEECFKRAVQVLPEDAESLNQYANFLWTVRRDFVGAEERFLQALSIEPDNPYYASRYANFLWSTGGEETCFPLSHSHETNSL